MLLESNTRRLILWGILKVTTKVGIAYLFFLFLDFLDQHSSAILPVRPAVETRRFPHASKRRVRFHVPKKNPKDCSQPVPETPPACMAGRKNAVVPIPFYQKMHPDGSLPSFPCYAIFLSQMLLHPFPFFSPMAVVTRARRCHRP